MNRTLLDIVNCSFCFLILFSCQNKVEEQSTQKEWRKMNCGLYVNQQGDIAFATRPEIAFKKKEQLKAEECPNNFLATFDWDTDQTLKSVIDTSTFQYLGSCYYKDKYRIYSHYDICDGGHFNKTNMHPDSLELLNEYYARYQNQILHFRKGQLGGVDPSTFRTDSILGQLAKDKDGYWEFGERKTLEELDSSHFPSATWQRLQSL